MNLVKFVDNRFQELKLQEREDEQRKEYCLPRDAEIKALAWVLDTYRTTVKWLMVPKVLFDFVWMRTGIGREPQPVLIRKMAADQKAEFEAKAKKLGMHGKLKALSDESVESLPN